MYAFRRQSLLHPEITESTELVSVIIYSDARIVGRPPPPPPPPTHTHTHNTHHTPHTSHSTHTTHNTHTVRTRTHIPHTPHTHTPHNTHTPHTHHTAQRTIKIGMYISLFSSTHTHHIPHTHTPHTHTHTHTHHTHTHTHTPHTHTTHTHTHTTHTHHTLLSAPSRSGCISLSSSTRSWQCSPWPAASSETYKLSQYSPWCSFIQSELHRLSSDSSSSSSTVSWGGSLRPSNQIVYMSLTQHTSHTYPRHTCTHLQHAGTCMFTCQTSIFWKPFSTRPVGIIHHMVSLRTC